jgi:hypothetical protein
MNHFIRYTVANLKFVRRCSSSNNRSFKVLGLQQVAIGGTDKEALRHFWIDLLGVKKIGEYKSEVKDVMMNGLYFLHSQVLFYRKKM